MFIRCKTHQEVCPGISGDAGRISLPKEAVDLYRILIPDSVLNQAFLFTFLSYDEIKKVLVIQNEKTKDCALYSYAIRRVILSRYLGIAPHEIQFCVNSHGKPGISPTVFYSLSFNLSHSRDMMILALCRDGDVGVDIEYIDVTISVMQIARRFFGKTEIAYLSDLPEPVRTEYFYSFWTAKEAFGKAVGIGLSLALRDLSLFSLPFQEYEEMTIEGRQWQRFSPLAGEKYRASLVVSLQR